MGYNSYISYVIIIWICYNQSYNQQYEFNLSQNAAWLLKIWVTSALEGAPGAVRRVDPGGIRRSIAALYNLHMLFFSPK
jgi:hypothetical protein